MQQAMLQIGTFDDDMVREHEATFETPVQRCRDKGFRSSEPSSDTRPETNSVFSLTVRSSSSGRKPATAIVRR